jgi:hypothetical protein
MIAAAERRMTRALASAIAMTLLTCLVISPLRAEQRPSYESLWAEATGQANAEIIDYPDFTMVKSGDGLTYYYFTKPSHFAHPGVVKRFVSQQNGTWVVTEKGWSFGADDAQPAFQKWLEQFKELDRLMKEDLQHERGSSPTSN